MPAESREAFQELVRELVDWRLAEYLERGADDPATGDRIPCKVSHSGGRPLLFLPDRTTHPGIPLGTRPVLIESERYEARFVKVAVNVIRRPGSTQNELPALMKAWFGPDAGRPGTNFWAVFERDGDAYRLSPLRTTDAPDDVG